MKATKFKCLIMLISCGLFSITNVIFGMEESKQTKPAMALYISENDKYFMIPKEGEINFNSSTTITEIPQKLYAQINTYSNQNLLTVYHDPTHTNPLKQSSLTTTQKNIIEKQQKEQQYIFLTHIDSTTTEKNKFYQLDFSPPPLFISCDLKYVDTLKQKQTEHNDQIAQIHTKLKRQQETINTHSNIFMTMCYLAIKMTFIILAFYYQNKLLPPLTTNSL